MISLAYNNQTQRGDLVRAVTPVNAQNLLTDAGLETAVTVSLFTDARAQEADALSPAQDPRGWWGGQYLDQEPGELGSRLWLVFRQKMTAATLLECSEFAEEALQWLVDAGVASNVDANTVRMPGATPQQFALLTVGIQRPSKLAPKFQKAWTVQYGI